jgi:hypothetical protein
VSAYLESLVDELRDYETSQERRRFKSDCSYLTGHSSKDLRALGLLRTEALRVAALVAVSASLANDAARPSCRLSSSETLLFTPAFPLAMDAQIAALAENESFFELYQLWLAMNAKLSFTNTLAAARAAEALRATEGHMLSAEVVADAWCRTCSVLRDLIVMVVQLMDVHGVTVSPPQEAQGIALLEEAASGRSPCLDDDGSFSLPGWAERRREKRRRFVQPIRIGIGIKTFPATSENLSSNGILIAAGFMIPTGCQVVVHLQDGRRLEACVRWSEGNKSGLAFNEPLSNQDPLWSAVRDESYRPENISEKRLLRV